VDDLTLLATGSTSTDVDDRSLAPSEAAMEIFLRDVTARADAARQSLRNEAAALRAHEGIVFALMVACAVISILLVIAGVGLIAANVLAVGSLSELVALLSGSGSAWLRRVHKDTAKRREILTRQEQEEARVIRAMGVALMIPDEQKRNTAMAKLASTLTANLVV